MPRHYYATANDLLPVFARVESKLHIAYTLTGHEPSSKICTFSKGGDLPSLREAAPYPNAISCPSYLVTLEETKVRIQPVPQDDGSMLYALDQLVNPDSIALSHGGLFAPDVLLYGRVSSASKSPISMKLLRAFDAAISKEFARVKAFWIGPEAFVLFRKGCRLTIGANSPREYDLAE